jgi:DNA-binding CsgD family transcriptional regulator
LELEIVNLVDHKRDKAASLQSLRESERMDDMLSNVVQIVPDCSWSFARIEPNGRLDALLGSYEHRHTLQSLASELKKQLDVAARGPRIAASMCAADARIARITLVFADERKHFGILIIEREQAEATFTSSEITMLTLGLSVVSERLAVLGLTKTPKEITGDSTALIQYAKAETSNEAFYALNYDYEIMLAWTSDESDCSRLIDLNSLSAKHIPAVLEECVRNLTLTWTEGGTKIPGIAIPLPFLVLRVESLFGQLGRYIGVHIDRLRSPNSLLSAAAQFRISSRELDVLRLLLNGDRLETMAEHLSITSSTVQDHINSMLYKTASENRSELIARVLGWQSPSHPHSR